MISNKVEKKYIYLYIGFIILSLTMIGPIAYTAYNIDVPIIKLWKEIYIGILFIMAIYIMALNKNKKLLKGSLVVLLSYSIWIFFSIGKSSLNQILYQIKLDLFNILFVIITIVVLSTLTKYKNKKIYIEKIVRIILIITIINTVVGALQAIFAQFFVTEVLGLEWGMWERSYGISVVTTNGKLRPMGLLNNYIALGELLVIMIIVLIENKGIFDIKKSGKVFLITLFTVGIYHTTYKTAYLWLMFYFGIKIFFALIKHIEERKKIDLSKNLNIHYTDGILSIIMFLGVILQWIISNTFILYRLIEKIFPNFAYTSVYLRVEFHQNLIRQMQSFSQKLLGVGMGINGTFTGKIDSNIEVIPLDSTYVYQLSNYGFLGLAIYIGSIITIFILSIMYKEKDILGIKYIVMYLLVIQLFFNNISTNVPISYIIIFFILVFLYEIKDCIIEEFKKINK